jgi:cytochrome c oxidase assembly protein subunit 15
MPYHKALHRFAVFTSFCVFFLIIAGGLVTSTGSGLAVPDWPLSYGKLMPPMVGGIFYEHGHRMIATFVGMLTVILAVWLWKRDNRRWMKLLGFVALATVVIQGLLGGLTVMFLLPTAISVSHATLAQTFFALVASIALFTSRWWRDDGVQLLDGGTNTAWLLRAGLLSVAVVYVQLILGALMRHTGSGLAVPDFPLAYGQWLPSLAPDALIEYNRFLIYEDIRLAADGPITASQILIHMLHRGWALVVVAVLVWLVVCLYRQRQARLGFLASVLVGLLIAQVGLGIWTVLSQKSVAIATAHVATGALILVVSILSLLHVVKLSRGLSFSRAWSRPGREVLA